LEAQLTVGVVQVGPRLAGERDKVAGEFAVVGATTFGDLAFEALDEWHVRDVDLAVGGGAEPGDHLHRVTGEHVLGDGLLADPDALVDADDLRGLPGRDAGVGAQPMGVGAADCLHRVGVGRPADHVRGEGLLRLTGDRGVVGDVHASAARGSARHQFQCRGLSGACTGLHDDVLASAEGINDGLLLGGRVHCPVSCPAGRSPAQPRPYTRLA
jgi:hypothetical protein